MCAHARVSVSVCTSERRVLMDTGDMQQALGIWCDLETVHRAVSIGEREEGHQLLDIFPVLKRPPGRHMRICVCTEAE